MACPAAPPRRGSSATPRSSGRRPRERKPPPHPWSSGGPDDGGRLADHQPGEVIPIHAAPRRGEQLVGELQPHPQRAQRWVARSRRSPSSISCRVRVISSSRVIAGRDRRRPVWPVSCSIASRSARARSVHGPRPAIADRRAIERRHRQDARHARRQERLIRGGEVPVAQQRLDRAQSDPDRPAEQPRPGRPGQDRAVERRGRQLRLPVAARGGPGRCSPTFPPTGDRLTVRNSASSAPGAARLEARVDVLRAARSSSTPPSGFCGSRRTTLRDEVQAALEVVGRGRRDGPCLDHDRRVGASLRRQDAARRERAAATP